MESFSLYLSLKTHLHLYKRIKPIAYINNLYGYFMEILNINRRTLIIYRITYTKLQNSDKVFN